MKVYTMLAYSFVLHLKLAFYRVNVYLFFTYTPIKKGILTLLTDCQKIFVCHS